MNALTLAAWLLAAPAEDQLAQEQACAELAELHQTPSGVSQVALARAVLDGDGYVGIDLASNCLTID